MTFFTLSARAFGKTRIRPNVATYPPFLWITLYVVAVAAGRHTRYSVTACCIERMRAGCARTSFGKTPRCVCLTEGHFSPAEFFPAHRRAGSVKIDAVPPEIGNRRRFCILSHLPREIPQIARSVVTAPGSAPARFGMNYSLASAMRDLAAETTGYPKYLLAPEIGILLDAVSDLRQRMLFDFLWNTGARINEALAVTPADIVINASRPYVILHTLKQRQRPKPGRPRKNEPIKRAVPLLDEEFTIRLRDHLATFTKHRTKPVWGIIDDTARYWLNNALGECHRRGERFSIPTISPKTFRHSFAMHLAMNGALPVTLQAYMGHKDFKSTQYYLRVFTLDVGIGLNHGIRFSFPPERSSLLSVPPHEEQGGRKI